MKDLDESPREAHANASLAASTNEHSAGCIDIEASSKSKKKRGLAERWARLKQRFLHANWYLGRLVEIMGDRVSIDGCEFAVRSSTIKTKYKSSFITGVYEQYERKLLERHLPANCSVIELGACIGVLSCITNKKLSRPERHLVVEANPDLVPLLESNRDNNGCSFEILHAAACYADEKATFYIGDVFLGNSAHKKDGREVKVDAVRLGNLIAERDWTNVFLICDIEGGESDLIRKELDVLRQSVDWIIIEMHETVLGRAEIDNCLSLLISAGFELLESESDVYALKKSKIIPDNL